MNDGSGTSASSSSGAGRRADPVELGRTIADAAFAREGLSAGLAATAATSPAPSAADDPSAPVLPGPGLGARLHGGGDARFAVRELKGMGATGRVYAVLDRNLEREVAVKVLDRPALEAEAAEAFIAEARVTAALQHPNVLPVYDLDVTASGELFFTMKKIDGTSLGDAIAAAAEGRDAPRLRDANEIVSIFIAVANALQYAHHKGIVHQDIKPDNIMLGGFGEVLLLDWGSAKRAADAHARLYGTPLFMSPEQARGEGASAASDVYGLGAALFNALTLRYPTWDDDIDRFWDKKRAGTVDPPTAAERRRVPAPVLGIALKALAADPAARYRSVEAMAEDLRAFQAGLAVSAYRDPPWARFARWYRANRRLFWVATTSALALAVLGGWLGFDKLQERASWSLLYREDFASDDPAVLARHWRLLAKPWDAWNRPLDEVPLGERRHWHVADGALELASGDLCVDLAFRDAIAGDLRVEWDYTPTQANENLNCFIGADREADLTFHIGAFQDPRYCAMTKRGVTGIVDQQFAPEPLRVGRRYHYVMEKQGGHARLFIDGRRVFDYDDYGENDAIAAESFGFDCYADNRLRIEHVRVYNQPLPRRISPLAVGERLARAGQFDLAYQEFAEIRRAYPGSELEPRARFHQAVCAARAGRDALARQELADFIAANRDHELVPAALYEQATATRRLGDEPGGEALLRELARFRGDPALQHALAEIGERYRALVVPHPITVVGGSEYPDDIVAQLTAAHRDIRRWADLYGIPFMRVPFMQRSVDVLLNYGAYDYLLGTYADDDHTCARTLLMMGRFDELLARYPHLWHLRQSALLASERFDEALAGMRTAGRPQAEVEQVLFARGDFAALEASGGAWWDQVLIARGRAEEVLRRHPASSEGRSGTSMPFLDPRYQALMALGRYQQVLDEFRSPYAQAEAFIDLGRYDEAMAACPPYVEGLYLIALRAAEQGDLATAEAMIAKAAPAHVDERYDDTMSLAASHWLLPALIASLDGRTVDLRAAMADALANHRWTSAQCLWHSAALIAGEIDERAFRAQPCKRFLEARLHFARALRYDCLHQCEQALAEYRAQLALPIHQRPLTGIDSRICAWRARALAAELDSR